MSNKDKEMDQASFEKPRHWVALEELTPEYWADKDAQTRRGQEFYDKPIETLEKIEALDQSGVSRRDFLTIMGASMAMASFACARRPVNKIIPYVVQPHELTPGVPLFYASTIKTRGQTHGVIIKTREGRPIKLEGNDEHPINQGALSAEGQAAILSLYDPDRLKAPMKGAKAGSKTSINWNEADALVASALKDARRVRIVSYPIQSESTRRILREFMAGFSDAKLLEVDPLGRDDVAEGQLESYGNRVVPTYRFDEAAVVVSFGADFLGTWGNEVENSRGWAKGRKLFKNTDTLSKLFVYEANLSVTGANADERMAIVPGSEVAAALAVAYELIVNQKKGRFAGNAEVTGLLGGEGALDALLGKAGGIDHAKVTATAEALWEARGKSLVVGDGSVALQAVVNLLNSNLENEGKTVDGNGDVSTVAPMNRQLAQLMSELDSGAVDAVIFHRVNPVYFLPNGEAFANSLKKAKIVIGIQDRIDETNHNADVVLAESHDLESWGDSHPRPSFHTIQQPAISPIADTRSLEEIVIGWVRAGVKGSGLLQTVASNAKGNYYEYVKENWKQSLFGQFGKGQSFIDFWETSLQKGVLLGKPSPARERPFRTASLKIAQNAANALKPVTISKAKKGPAIEGSGIVLGLYTSAMGDGTYANNAWMQEFPDPISTVVWDNYLNVGPAFAAELGLANNDVVLIKNDAASFEIPVVVQPGIAKGAVTMALGYGRKMVGKVGNHVGQNGFRFAQFNGENGLSFGGIPVTVSKTGKKYELAVTQGHHRTEGRPVVNDITFAEWKKNPEAANHTDPHLRLKEVPTLWTPPVDYAKQPYKWIMGIDLNACTGCGACVVACQAENNIPVVGRDRVRQSREMHWLRIDRYYMGDENSPKVVFQPMLCQHCENAPCETVCPVVATSHSEDGLNQMTYSRCVGTRYCQNNCPYKVRRFNFFDHWKDYKDTMNMVWNPDVTVRSRGIMEKCTFCVQRINDAKGKAKDTNTKIKDKDLLTACQQTCPTEAIVFGNENDNEAIVNTWKNNPRAYRSLEILNTRPAIHYLSKVRNVEGGAEHHEEAKDGHHS